MASLTTTTQHSFGSPSCGNQRRKRKKRDPHQKRSKTLFADDMILYVENPKETIRKFLELNSEFSSHGIQGQYTEIT